MNQTQPVLFVPHGAPTFALRPGAAGAALVAKAATLALPRAIVIVSAHWDTAVPTVGFAEKLETIHDFWGFPEALYAIRYPATGCPEASREVVAAIAAAGLPVASDATRGLDQVQDDPAFFQVGGAGRGEGQPPRAARHQLDAEVRLQPGDLPGHHRAGDAQLLRGAGKAAQLGYPHEELHCIQSVHCCISSNSDLRIVVYFAAAKGHKVRPSLPELSP